MQLVDFATWGIQIKFVLYLVLFIGVIVAVVLLFLTTFRYNINVTLLKKTGNMVVEYKTKGGVFAKRRNQPEKLYIQKFKLEVEPPARKFYHISRKGRDCITLFMIDEGTAVPVEVMTDIDTTRIQPVDYLGSHWQSLRSKEKLQNYSQPNFWERFGSYIILGSALVIVVVLFVLTYKYMLDVGSQANVAANALATAADKLAQCSQTIQ